MLAAPLGRLAGRVSERLDSESRREAGLTLILPGLNGESTLHKSLAQGLEDAGVPTAIDLYDWTTGNIFLFWHYLRDWPRNLQQAALIAARIVDYQRTYPGRPVHLIGYSAGGPMALLALEALPPGICVTSVVLLAGSVAPTFNLVSALRAAPGGIWNYYSPLDLFFLGLGTIALGTLDRRHAVSAGAIGFQMPAGLTPEEQELYHTRLHGVPYEWRMALSFHFGGHFGWTNRVFAAEWLAPVLLTRGAPQPRIAVANSPPAPRFRRREVKSARSGGRGTYGVALALPVLSSIAANDSAAPHRGSAIHAVRKSPWQSQCHPATSPHQVLIAPSLRIPLVPWSTAPENSTDMPSRPPQDPAHAAR